MDGLLGFCIQKRVEYLNSRLKLSKKIGPYQRNRNDREKGRGLPRIRIESENTLNDAKRFIEFYIKNIEGEKKRKEKDYCE